MAQRLGLIDTVGEYNLCESRTDYRGREAGRRGVVVNSGFPEPKRRLFPHSDRFLPPFRQLLGISCSSLILTSKGESPTEMFISSSLHFPNM